MTEYERTIDRIKGQIIGACRKVLAPGAGDAERVALQEVLDEFDRLTAVVGEGGITILPSSYGVG